MLPQMSHCYESFHRAWLLLDACKETGQNIVEPDYALPWIVNGAFACELGMKYILECNNLSYHKEHLLHELFNKLPDKDAIAISSELIKQYPGYDKDFFSQNILLISDAFCNFRYAYEKNLVLEFKFCKLFFEAVFNQVATYPSYTLIERSESSDFTEKDFDEKALKTANEMLLSLSKKESKHSSSKAMGHGYE